MSTVMLGGQEILKENEIIVEYPIVVDGQVVDVVRVGGTPSVSPVVDESTPTVKRSTLIAAELVKLNSFYNIQSYKKDRLSRHLLTNELIVVEVISIDRMDRKLTLNINGLGELKVPFHMYTFSSTSKPKPRVTTPQVTSTGQVKKVSKKSIICEGLQKNQTNEEIMVEFKKIYPNDTDESIKSYISGERSALKKLKSAGEVK